MSIVRKIILHTTFVYLVALFIQSMRCHGEDWNNSNSVKVAIICVRSQIEKQWYSCNLCLLTLFNTAGTLWHCLHKGGRQGGGSGHSPDLFGSGHPIWKFVLKELMVERLGQSGHPIKEFHSGWALASKSLCTPPHPGHLNNPHNLKVERKCAGS